MTKYILHGGRSSVPSPNNQEFFDEICKDLPKKITVLSVLFARSKTVWEEKFEEDKRNFTGTQPKKTFTFILASEDLTTFIDQIKQADVINLKGGITSQLQTQLAQIPNLEALFSGKVIVGSSAGALVLSKYYYENDKDKFSQGLGILPIKTFCHYTEEKSGKLTQLISFVEPLESVYAIPEGEFVVIEQ